MNPTNASHPGNRLFLTFHGDTLDLLRKLPGKDETIIYLLNRRASIKDILESLGVPHTEIGRIVLAGQEQNFTKIAKDGEHYNIHPLSPETLPTMATPLRPEPLAACNFLVDINVGKLARLLRMVGCDAASVTPNISSKDIVEKALWEERILLTRNRDLLKQRNLVFGRLLRTQDPAQQLAEIINLYCLKDQLHPFSRCIACNGILRKVDKEGIVDQLLPLTKKYFGNFNQCTGCGKIYWRGSHHDKMREKIEKIL